MFDETFWEERYRSAPTIWSGQPNQVLVDEITNAPAGFALDVGCGEGADAIWLAERGWRVTAVDISGTAVARGRDHAEARGQEVAGRIDWRRADVLAWSPAAAEYDLVSAQYVHVASAEREALLPRLAAAVRPGGLLLIGAHHPSDLETTARRPPLRDLFYTAEDVAQSLDPEQWDVLVAEARPRAAPNHHGHEVTVKDTVLSARRRH